MKRHIFLVCFWLVVYVPSSVKLSCDQSKMNEISRKLFPHQPAGGIWIRLVGADGADHVGAAKYWNKRLRIELFSLSENSHTLLNVDEQQDREFEHRAIASAVVKALMDLPTMKQTDDIVTRATFEAVTLNIWKATCDDKVWLNIIDVEELFHDYLITINDTMRTSEPMYEAMYALGLESLPSELPGYDEVRVPQQPPLWHMNNDNIDLEKPILRQAFVNKVFIKEAKKYQYDCPGNDKDDEDIEDAVDSWFANGLIELVKQSDDVQMHAKLKAIYHVCVRVVSESDPWTADEETVKNNFFNLLHGFMKKKNLYESWKQSVVRVMDQRKFLKSVYKDTPV